MAWQQIFLSLCFVLFLYFISVTDTACILLNVFIHHHFDPTGGFWGHSSGFIFSIFQYLLKHCKKYSLGWLAVFLSHTIWSKFLSETVILQISCLIIRYVNDLTVFSLKSAFSIIAIKSYSFPFCWTGWDTLSCMLYQNEKKGRQL